MILTVIGILLVLAFWGGTFQNWRRGVYMLLIYVPFAGGISLLMQPSQLPLLFKDFFFVIPAYLAYWWSSSGRAINERVPNPVRYTMLALAAMVLVQSFNPDLPNLWVAAIGAKVWLFYLPLIFLSFAIVESRDTLIRLLRLMVSIAWIPCIVGIWLWISSMIYGYEATMFAFYGAAAEGATQNFATFDVGGLIYRIPSTFSFVAQYFGFTLAMIVPAYALTNLDTSGKWRIFSRVTMWLVILASLLSGARAAYLFIPILLTLIYMLERKYFGVVIVMLALPLALLTAMYIAGIDPVKMFELMRDLFLNYSDDVAKQGLMDAIARSPIGTGTGMNTGPARFAFDDPASFAPLENYYAKTVVELGLQGLGIVVALFLILLSQGYKIHRRIQNAGLRSCSAAFLAFIITMVLNSFKGWQIDLDPINVYFWVFSGFLLKLGYLDKLQQKVCQRIENPSSGCSDKLPQTL